jgi:hypothetical protein
VEGLASQGQEVGRQEKVQRTGLALHTTEHPLEKSQKPLNLFLTITFFFRLLKAKLNSFKMLIGSIDK